jgi:LuxR family maltose regulon positive regulatory protein
LIPELHRRASAWYAKNNLMSEAIAHSLAAGDFEQAAQLTEQTFIDRMSRGEDFATMLARLVALPGEIIRARPRLSIMYAWMLSITLQLDAVEPRLQEVERQAGDQLPADLQLQIAHIRAELARHRGNHDTAIELSHRVLQGLPENRTFTDMQTLTGTVFNLAYAYLGSGDTANAHHWMSEGLDISRAAGSPHMILLATASLAQIYELQGQLNQAIETCHQGLSIADEIAQKIGHELPAVVYVHLRLGNLLREQNKLNEAEHHLTLGMEIGRKW